MIDRVQAALSELRELSHKLSDPEVIADRAIFTKAASRHKQLSDCEDLLKKYAAAYAAKEEAEALLLEDDATLKALAEEQKMSAEKTVAELHDAVRAALIPKNPLDNKNVIIEIRAGTGGEEAALFAAELTEGYAKYCESLGLNMSLLSVSDADAGGYKEAIASITGVDAFRYFKFEAGTHRVQRIPTTESKGRIHTSAVTVAVLPEAEEVDVHIEQKDLEIDTFCASGAGGQHVNRTESAVRITHTPTGISVACQTQRSQHQNKIVAMNMLRTRLMAEEQERLQKERAGERSAQVGTGDRSEKIRTYNFPQDRVTDHRIGKNFPNLPGIMTGAFSPITQALLEDAAAKEELV